MLAAKLNAGGTRRATLVHAGGGVGQEQLDTFERHVEFFGHDLCDGDGQSVTHVHLAEERGDRAIRVDCDIGRQLIRCQRRPRALRESGSDARHGLEREGSADRNDQGASTGQDRAAGEGNLMAHLDHSLSPSFRLRV